LTSFDKSCAAISRGNSEPINFDRCAPNRGPLIFEAIFDVLDLFDAENDNLD
jgi:hypothetical protein